MEWEDAHLWEFTLGRERISSSRAARLTLQDLLRPRVTKLGYTYDMGDCWEHQLTLTKPGAADPAFLPALPRRRKPGAAGRLRRHPRLLCTNRTLADPHHLDHEDAEDWFGDFDPKHFDEQPIKDRLARIANRRRSVAAKRQQR